MTSRITRSEDLKIGESLWMVDQGKVFNVVVASGVRVKAVGDTHRTSYLTNVIDFETMEGETLVRSLPALGIYLVGTGETDSAVFREAKDATKYLVGLDK